MFLNMKSGFLNRQIDFFKKFNNWSLKGSNMFKLSDCYNVIVNECYILSK